MKPTFPAPPTAGRFALGDADAYARWRDGKLAAYPEAAAPALVEIADAAAPSAAECAALRARMGTTNMALYAAARCSCPPAEAVRRLAAGLGLARLEPSPSAGEDGVAGLAADAARGRYIPFTDQPLNWHTDGYYNPWRRRVQAFVLHCVRAAAEGGGTALIDHEIAYILLRDTDPDLIAALSHPGAMTIPANHVGGVTVRGAQGGPVFAVDAASGELHMRYTARPRHVVWRDEATTRAAVARLGDILAGAHGYVVRRRLEPGQGVVCNNVLHRRDGFVDGAGGGRLVYRARYRDRVERSVRAAGAHREEGE